MDLIGFGVVLSNFLTIAMANCLACCALLIVAHQYNELLLGAGLTTNRETKGLFSAAPP
jgi:hypothetical protein